MTHAGTEAALIAPGTSDALALLRTGTVIPAHPLALTEAGSFDERHQRALTRYQLAAGVGGVAVGVHSTEFAIREADVGLLAPVLELAAETVRAEATRTTILVGGAVGPTAQAVSEAELAAGLGYHAVLLSPGGLAGASEADLVARTRAVAEVLPVIGFYLQPAVGGRALSQQYWHDMAAIEGVVAIKAAPFDRYATLDVLRAVADCGRDDLVVYTGNDDSILHDLITPLGYPDGAGGLRSLWMRGGLLGQWAVWTRRAVEMFERVQRLRGGDGSELPGLLRLAPQLTDANSAVFDAANAFRGCIPGIKEVLRRQGLLDSIRCLDPDEQLSPGQAAELDRVTAAYPWLTDDTFIAEHRDGWLS
ncbi:dihydrodipicolinate synthase family protein [Occultella glacieicola]|uniref:Dihydrodipicolinate synthase family protein n=1 Tax=Occultella glacieicola TaxID=2518684 RepID=A0ABY2E7E4_9MICO|nr:dihydrodipicolinate synthase family protein [Occultella glacieicola]TDE92792.1 dihydrodipicolinate synthase family protein [Occultella glacieicola]